MKRLFTILAFIIIAITTNAQQHYKPSLHAGPQNKPSGISSATPLDSRSWFYDTLSFSYRPYANRAEVLSYLYLASYRSGQFTIIIDSASHKWAYWFRDGTADANLVLQYNFAAATTDSSIFATLYRVDTAKANLRASIAGKISTTLSTGQILVGNLSNVATAVTPSGVLTMTSGGSFDYANNSITYTKLQTIPSHSVFGRPDGTSGNSRATYVGYGTLFDSDTIKVDTTTLKAVFGSNSLSFENGITNTAGTVKLGGLLTGNTTIDGDGTWFLKMPALSDVFVESYDTLDIKGATTIIESSNTAPNSVQIKTGAATIRLKIDNNGVITLPTLTQASLDTTSNKVQVFNPTSKVISYMNWPSTGGGSGVTNVATGYGLSGGPITTTGTLLVDSATLSNYYLRRKDSSLYFTKYRGDTLATNVYNALNGKQPTGNYITSLTGPITANGPGAAATTITNNAVTYAKIQAASGQSLLGATGAGNFQEITLGTNLSMAGSVLNASGSGTSTATTTFLGSIYNKKTGWSTLADFTQSGSTFAASSSNIVVTNGSAGFTGNEIAINYGTCLEKFTQTIRFIVTSSSGSSGGLAIGMISTGTPSISAFGKLVLSGASSGKVTLNLEDNTQYAISSSALSYSNGDTLLLSLTRDRELISVYAQNVTTKSARVVANYIYTVASTPSMPNTGNFCVYNMGGTQTLTIDSISVYSTALKNSTVYVLGNSKTEYSTVSQFQNGFVSRLGQNFTVINGGGIGDQTAQFLTRLTEIENLAPQYAVLADLMSNDQRNGVSSATYQANYQKIRDTLRAHGIRIIHASPFYETSIDLSAQQSFVNSTFSADTIVNVYDPLRITANVLNGDGIHPNNLGDSIAYTAIIAPFKIAGAGKPPTTFGEGVNSRVALWGNPRQLTSDNLNFVTNTLTVPGYASIGDFKAYTQAPIWAGRFPAGQPTIMFYQSGAGTNQKISRLWSDNGVLEYDYFKDDTSGTQLGFSIAGNGTTPPVITMAGKTYINRMTDDGSADPAKLQVNGGISTTTTSALDVYLGVIGNYDHYVGYGRLGSGNPYWYMQNLNAGTNQKLWDGNYDATGVFTFRALSDGAGGATPIYNVDRSAYPAIKFNYQVPVLLNASTTTAGTSAIKFLAGPPPTTPETGAMNFNTGVWIIDSSTSKRDTIATRSWTRANSSTGSSDTAKLRKVGAGEGLLFGGTHDTLNHKALRNATTLSDSSLLVNTLENADQAPSVNRTISMTSHNLVISGTTTNLMFKNNNVATVNYGISVSNSAPHYFALGWTSSAGAFTRGAGLYIDTFNNVSTSATSVSYPGYANGSNFYVGGNQITAQAEYPHFLYITGNTTLDANTHIVYVDATSGSITVTLPAVSAVSNLSSNQGQGIVYTIKRIDASINTVTISPNGSDTIDLTSSLALTSLLSRTIQAAGSGKWFVQ